MDYLSVYERMYESGAKCSHIRPSATAMDNSMWRRVLLTQSGCLALPVVRPAEFDSAHAAQQREDAKDLRQAPLTAPAVAQAS
jgi:hypothetical protein